MSTVRTAVLKLAAIGAGAALVGGGAVHVAEKAHEGKPQYVKHEKRVKLVRPEQPVPPRPATPCCMPDKRVAVAPMMPPPAPEAYAEGPPPEGEFVGGFAGGGGHYRRGHRWHGGEGPTPVPAPPMLVLFGAAAASIIARRKAKQAV